MPFPPHPFLSVAEKSTLKSIVVAVLVESIKLNALTSGPDPRLPPTVVQKFPLLSAPAPAAVALEKSIRVAALAKQVIAMELMSSSSVCFI